ncbi:putative AraC-family transcriptional regulator [Streptomyces sp. Tu6071]|nr:putative AraC-family transcriptional regulator [Streptomyces sp. Tu6071]
MELTVAVAAGGLADEGGESLDEARRIGPAAGESGVGDGLPRREPGERVMDAQLGAPLVETHPEFLPEEPAECPLARPDARAELGERLLVGGVGVEDAGQRPEPVVGRFGQMQRLFGRRRELVDDDRPEPVDRLRSPPAGLRLLGREREQGFAGEPGDGEHGGMRGQPGGERAGQEQNPHVRVAVRGVVVLEGRGRPRHPGRRSDPRTPGGGHGQHAGRRIDQVAAVVGMGGQPLPVRQDDAPACRGAKMAGFPHGLASYR